MERTYSKQIYLISRLRLKHALANQYNGFGQSSPLVFLSIFQEGKERDIERERMKRQRERNIQTYLFVYVCDRKRKRDSTPTSLRWNGTH